MAELKEAQRDHIDSDKFAFPKERKEPIHDAAHVRYAIARFNQVEGVSDDERDAAWRRSAPGRTDDGVAPSTVARLRELTGWPAAKLVARDRAGVLADDGRLTFFGHEAVLVGGSRLHGQLLPLRTGRRIARQQAIGPGGGSGGGGG